jgi:hypothetical protein
VISPLLMAVEHTARSTGNWGGWRTQAVSVKEMAAVLGVQPRGWMKDVNTVHRLDWCVVLVRPVGLSYGTETASLLHASIKTASGVELRWSEKQRLKDELFGKEQVAIEIFPRHADIVDDAPMSHLWIMPQGFVFDFGLHLNTGRTDGETDGDSHG